MLTPIAESGRMPGGTCGRSRLHSPLRRSLPARGSIVKWLLITCCAWAGSSRAAENFCDTGKPHPIEIRLENEIRESGGVTATMRDAQSKAYEQWDTELNRVYADLLASLHEEDRELLRDSERAWIGYRDAQIKWLWSKAMYGEEGTLGPVIVSEAGRALVADRVCQLDRYRKQVYGPTP